MATSVSCGGMGGGDEPIMYVPAPPRHPHSCNLAAAMMPRIGCKLLTIVESTHTGEIRNVYARVVVFIISTSNNANVPLRPVDKE